MNLLVRILAVVLVGIVIRALPAIP